MTTLTHRNEQHEDRWQTILDLWRGNQWLYALVGFFAGILTFPAINMLVNDALNLLGGIVPEAIGIAFTVFIIERYNRRRDEHQEIDQLKRDLVRRAGSKVNDVARDALEEIEHHGWSIGNESILQGKKLPQANWRDANLTKFNLDELDLHHADLTNTNLKEASLQNARLNYASLAKAYLFLTNLSDAWLGGANLEKTHLHHAFLINASFGIAHLYKADFHGANLTNAKFLRDNLTDAQFVGAYLINTSIRESNLSNANLFRAILYGTNFTDSNLQGANLYKAHFDSATILPDGTHWTPDTDWTKFGAVMLPPEDWERYQRGWRPDTE